MRVGSIGVGVLGLYLGVLNVACSGGGPLLEPTASMIAREPVTDDMLDVARRYAPVLYHETATNGWRQDIPGNIDFDGDLQGNNNWENFSKFRLTPTVYYTVVESETHYFIAYHVFHPRDWSWIRLGVQDIHENDGENLQVVVRKEDGRVKLLFTQAHFKGRIHREFVTIDDSGAVSESGTHVAVYVESCGHGIYNAHGKLDVGTWKSGLVMRCARAGEIPAEPDDRAQTVLYRLESTVEKLWKNIDALYGDGRLFDQSTEFLFDGKRYLIPMYYDGDLYSGPLGNDRGMSPFALDVDYCAPKLGSFFVDPAGRYAELLKLDEGWSRKYVRNSIISPSNR
jgi:hypothetical protein